MKLQNQISCNIGQHNWHFRKVCEEPESDISFF